HELADGERLLLLGRGEQVLERVEVRLQQVGGGWFGCERHRSSDRRRSGRCGCLTRHRPTGRSPVCINPENVAPLPREGVTLPPWATGTPSPCAGTTTTSTGT